MMVEYTIIALAALSILLLVLSFSPKTNGSRSKNKLTSWLSRWRKKRIK